MSLQDYGWTEPFITAFEIDRQTDERPGRVILEHRQLYRVQSADGGLNAVLPGRLRHHATGRGSLPVVGDWVTWRRSQAQEGDAIIERVLPRRSQIMRKTADKRTEEQFLAANVDTIFVVMGLDGDFNPRRLERFLALAWESQTRPVVLLSKADLCSKLPETIAEIENIALGVPVHAISCYADQGIEEVRQHLRPGETVVLLGSSGAGKSTLVNHLCGREILRTGGVRQSDDRGRHTTTHRQLVLLPGGALLIDSPGLREIQLWTSGDGLQQAFADIHEWAQECRYRDCHHLAEPGCAVRAAVESGHLPGERLHNFHGLEKEQRYLETRQDVHARREAQRQTAAVHRAIRRLKPRR